MKLPGFLNRPRRGEEAPRDAPPGEAGPAFPRPEGAAGDPAALLGLPTPGPLEGGPRVDAISAQVTDVGDRVDTLAASLAGVERQQAGVADRIKALDEKFLRLVALLEGSAGHEDPFGGPAGPPPPPPPAARPGAAAPEPAAEAPAGGAGPAGPRAHWPDDDWDAAPPAAAPALGGREGPPPLRSVAPTGPGPRASLAGAPPLPPPPLPPEPREALILPVLRAGSPRAAGDEAGDEVARSVLLLEWADMLLSSVDREALGYLLDWYDQLGWVDAPLKDELLAYCRGLLAKADEQDARKPRGEELAPPGASEPRGHVHWRQDLGLHLSSLAFAARLRGVPEGAPERLDERIRQAVALRVR